MAGLMHSPVLSSALSLPGLRRTNRVKVLDLNLGFGVKNSRKRVVPLDSPQAYRGRSSRLRINVVAAAATSTVEIKEKEKDKEKGKEEEKPSLVSFADPKWKKGSWDIQQFTKDGNVDWDAVIDSEVRRRKWLEDNPEASSNSEPVVFDTSIVPWWAWVKRFHLPQAELLNGRAAMVGFFMAYAVDSLTGIGLVDQMSSFLGKLFLFIAVTGVLVIRNNEDIANLKQIVKEFNLYDKQWQATWQDEKPENMGKDS